MGKKGSIPHFLRFLSLQYYTNITPNKQYSTISFDDTTYHWQIPLRLFRKLAGIFLLIVELIKYVRFLINEEC